jgi:hypothetical protein
VRKKMTNCRAEENNRFGRPRHLLINLSWGFVDERSLLQTICRHQKHFLKKIRWRKFRIIKLIIDSGKEQSRHARVTRWVCEKTPKCSPKRFFVKMIA